MIFLRPWFLLLLPVIFLLYLLRKKLKNQNVWKKYVSSKLQPYLLISHMSGKKEKSSFLKIAFLWSLLVVALAGPAYEKTPIETGANLDGTILVVDLNSLNHSTLMQLKVKLSETLKHLKDERVGLVLYDKKGYVALPMTQDLQIIHEMIASLSPSVLPEIGNHPEQGFKTAIEQFKNNNLSHGRILFFTGGLDGVDAVLPIINNTNYKIGVLALGAEGVKTPVLSSNGQFQRDANNNPVLVAPNKNILSKLGTVVFATPNNDDIKQLIKQSKIHASETLFNQATNDLLKIDSYKDMGVYLVVCLMPFIALLFRKGIFFILILCLCTPNAYASIWIREDQKLYQVNQQAVQDYHSKDYLSALAGFTQDNSQTGLYNQANAKAHMGYFQEAIDLYNQVLEQNNQHSEAKFNKEYLERLMKKNQQNQQSQNNNQESQDESNPESQNQNSDKSDNQDNQSENNDENKNNSDDNTQGSSDNSDSNQNSEESNSSNKNESPQETKTDNSDIENKENQSQINENKQEKQEENPSQNSQGFNEQENKNQPIDQSSQEIFNRLKKDPSRLLKYRLYNQNRRNK